MDTQVEFKELSCEEFIHQLSTKSAVPGGGGASAMTGAIGAALAGMVTNLTIGKKKFIHLEVKLQDIRNRAREMESDMLGLIDEDAEVFLPLSQAYGLRAETEEERSCNDALLQEALINATEVPLNIMRKANAAIQIHEELIQGCSRLAVSDVGVGVQCLRAALTGGYLNVAINLKSIRNNDYVSQVSFEAEALLKNGCALAEAVYNKTLSIIESS